MGAIYGLWLAQYEVLREHGHSPSEAFNETVEEATQSLYPLIAENGAVVPVSVEVNAPMTPQSYVKHIYVVADKNRIPIVTRVALTPASGQAYMGANIRLGETTDVRAIVEQSDGTLFALKREVKVTVGGCGG